MTEFSLPWHSLVLPKPSRALWQFCVDNGFEADGASWSPDILSGVRIGLTGTDFRPDLPANLHDLRFFMSRESTRLALAAERDHKMPLLSGPMGQPVEWWTKSSFREANREIRAGISYRLTTGLEGFWGMLQGGWPWIYWLGVSGTAGWHCWTSQRDDTPRQKKRTK